MALVDPHQADEFLRDPFSRPIPHQPALQNAWVPPAPANGQHEGHREDILTPVRHEVAWIGRAQDLHHFDVAYEGVVDYHSQPLVDNVAYGLFPDIGHAQGIPGQAQPNVPVNLERNPFSYVPQHNVPHPVQPTLAHPFFVHRTRTPNQAPAGAEGLRRLAIRYLHHPGTQVDMVSMEVGAAGRVKVVVVLESHDVF